MIENTVEKDKQKRNEEMSFSYKEGKDFNVPIPPKTQIISEEKIKLLQDQLKVDFTKDEISKLKVGEPVFKQNMKFESSKENKEGKIVDGTIQFEMKNGVLKTNIESAKSKLEIPNTILDHPLTKKEKEKLQNGEFVTIEPKNSNQKLLLKVDEKLNKVTIQTPKDVGIPTKVGEYDLSKQDIEKLANKEQLTPKVFEDKKTGTFFVANLAFNKDKSELSFENIKEVTPKEAQKLKEIYNKPDNVLSAVANVGIEKGEKKIEENKEVSKGKEAGKLEISTEDKLPKQIQEAIDKNDIKKLVEIKDQHPLNEKQVKNIATNPEMNKDTKIVILTALGKSDALDKIDNKLKIDSNKAEKKENKINIQKQPEVKENKKKDKGIQR